MKVIGVTGPRALTNAQTAEAAAPLKALLTPGVLLHVGDAAGLDAP